LFAKLDKRALSIPFVSGGELLSGKRFSLSYWRERLSADVQNVRSRHPRLIGHSKIPPAKRSTFLGEHLFEDIHSWIDPDAREKLKTLDSRNYVTWKLLFHWKAWQWLHEGRLEAMLGSHANLAVQRIPEVGELRVASQAQ